MTLRAILLAYEEPSSVPSHLRVFSENRSVKQYQQVFEAVSGEQLKVINVSLDEAETDYEKRKSSIPEHMLGMPAPSPALLVVT